jgi:DNA-binding NarL/FixJ family response regulator
MRRSAGARSAAQRLVVSHATVQSHIKNLFHKAGLRDRAQAVNHAYRTGIAMPPHERAAR